MWKPALSVQCPKGIVNLSAGSLKYFTWRGWRALYSFLLSNCSKASKRFFLSMEEEEEKEPWVKTESQYQQQGLKGRILKVTLIRRPFSECSNDVTNLTFTRWPNLSLLINACCWWGGCSSVGDGFNHNRQLVVQTGNWMINMLPPSSPRDSKSKAA